MGKEGTIKGDLWELYTSLDEHEAIAIPTNGTVKNNGDAVMGKGLALEAAKRCRELPQKLGVKLRVSGNVPYYFQEYKVVTFPTKNDWTCKADLDLIRRSCGQLNQLIELNKLTRVYVPKVGCGNGRLAWTDVRPMLETHLGRRCVIVI